MSKRYRITCDECGNFGVEVKLYWFAPWVDDLEAANPFEPGSPYPHVVFVPVRRKTRAQYEKWIEYRKSRDVAVKAKERAKRRHVVEEIE